MYRLLYLLRAQSREAALLFVPAFRCHKCHAGEPGGWCKQHVPASLCQASYCNGKTGLAWPPPPRNQEGWQEADDGGGEVRNGQSCGGPGWGRGLEWKQDPTFGLDSNYPRPRQPQLGRWELHHLFEATAHYPGEGELIKLRSGQ